MIGAETRREAILMATITQPVAAIIAADRPKPPPAQVLYDGECPLCLKSVALLRRLDWRHRLAFINARDPERVPACQPPLEPDRLLQEMHLVTPHGAKVYRGFR